MFGLFATLLAGGMLLVLSLGRLRETAWKYVRLIGILAFALTALVTTWRLLGPQSSGAPGSSATTQKEGDAKPPADERVAVALLIGCGVAAVGVLMAAPGVQSKPQPVRALCVAGGLCGVAAGCAWTAAAAQHGEIHPRIGLPAWYVVRLLQAMLLGSVSVSWLLGHAYLTATKMTIAPLRRFASVLVASFAARALMVGVVAALSLRNEAAAPGALRSMVGSIADLGGLIFWVRILVGLVVVGVFIAMIRGCIRLRSTQSATGLLYFTSVLTYIGELCGEHVSRETGWPF